MALPGLQRAVHGSHRHGLRGIAHRTAALGYAFWRACTSKKGVSALEIKRHCQISYKSALFLMNRIRFAMAPDIRLPRNSKGTVECDETYIGGKPRYKGIEQARTRHQQDSGIRGRGAGGPDSPSHRCRRNRQDAERRHSRRSDRQRRIMTDEYIGLPASVKSSRRSRNGLSRARKNTFAATFTRTQRKAAMHL